MQRGVQPGPLDGRFRRLAGEPGAIVAQQGAKGLVVAARNDHVRHRLWHLGARGHGAQVALAVLADHLQQVLIGQQGRGAQNGCGHRRFRIVGQGPDQAARREGGRAEPFGQLGAHRRLHVAGDFDEDAAVGVSLDLAGAGGAEEAAGELAQQGAPALAGGFPGERDQLGQSGVGVVHGRVDPSGASAGTSRPRASRNTIGGPSGAARSTGT